MQRYRVQVLAAAAPLLRMQVDWLVGLGVVDFFDAGRVSISATGLSGRMRTMRGKRSAKPLAWREERITLLKATSRTTVRLDGAEVAVVFEGVGLEQCGHLGDFLVGEAGVGFADVFERRGGIVGIANGEGGSR